MDILLILLDILKMSIATCRWGELTDEDVQIVINAPF